MSRDYKKILKRLIIWGIIGGYILSIIAHIIDLNTTVLTMIVIFIFITYIVTIMYFYSKYKNKKFSNVLKYNILIFISFFDYIIALLIANKYTNRFTISFGVISAFSPLLLHVWLKSKALRKKHRFIFYILRGIVIIYSIVLIYLFVSFVILKQGKVVGGQLIK